jgi:hypothetical protein
VSSAYESNPSSLHSLLVSPKDELDSSSNESGLSSARNIADAGRYITNTKGLIAYRFINAVPIRTNNSTIPELYQAEVNNT